MLPTDGAVLPAEQHDVTKYHFISPYKYNNNKSPFSSIRWVQSALQTGTQALTGTDQGIATLPTLGKSDKANAKTSAVMGGSMLSAGMFFALSKIAGSTGRQREA